MRALLKSPPPCRSQKQWSLVYFSFCFCYLVCISPAAAAARHSQLQCIEYHATGHSRPVMCGVGLHGVRRVLQVTFKRRPDRPWMITTHHTRKTFHDQHIGRYYTSTPDHHINRNSCFFVPKQQAPQSPSTIPHRSLLNSYVTGITARYHSRRAQSKSR